MKKQSFFLLIRKDYAGARRSISPQSLGIMPTWTSFLTPVWHQSSADEFPHRYLASCQIWACRLQQATTDTESPANRSRLVCSDRVGCNWLQPTPNRLSKPKKGDSRGRVFPLRHGIKPSQITNATTGTTDTWSLQLGWSQRSWLPARSDKLIADRLMFFQDFFSLSSSFIQSDF